MNRKWIFLKQQKDNNFVKYLACLSSCCTAGGLQLTSLLPLVHHRIVEGAGWARMGQRDMFSLPGTHWGLSVKICCSWAKGHSESASHCLFLFLKLVGDCAVQFLQLPCSVKSDFFLIIHDFKTSKTISSIQGSAIEVQYRYYNLDPIQ